MSEPTTPLCEEAPSAAAASALPHPPWPGSFPVCQDYGRDVPESWICDVAPVVLRFLLADRSTGHNIRWCSDDYTTRGEGFGVDDEITADRICGPFPVIRPRVDKRLEEQKARAAAKGEVFTPAWVCNAQNNLVDQAWFGFNKPIFNAVDVSGRNWTPTDDRTLWSFMRRPGRKDSDYIRLVRLEVACGEAPYLTSRYDAADGAPIAVSRRIGLLDRKLRVVSGKSQSREKWLQLAMQALQSVYAFDWQGDNVLLARENLLFATLEAFAARWPDTPGISLSAVESLASVLSWNVFQMDGLKFVIPHSCHDEAPPPQPSLSLDVEPQPHAMPLPCPGCKTGDHRLHNGVRPIVVDWSKSDVEPRTMPFHKIFPSASHEGTTA